MVAGSVRYRTTRSPEASRPRGANPAGGSHAAATAATLPTAVPAAARPRSARRIRLTAPGRSGRLGPGSAAEERLAVLPRDALGHLGRQVIEPGARPGRVLGHVVPPLGHERVGADHEAVGELEKERAPLGPHLAAG